MTRKSNIRTMFGPIKEGFSAQQPNSPVELRLLSNKSYMEEFLLPDGDFNPGAIQDPFGSMCNRRI